MHVVRLVAYCFVCFILCLCCVVFRNESGAAVLMCMCALQAVTLQLACASGSASGWPLQCQRLQERACQYVGGFMGLSIGRSVSAAAVRGMG